MSCCVAMISCKIGSCFYFMTKDNSIDVTVSSYSSNMFKLPNENLITC